MKLPDEDEQATSGTPLLAAHEFFRHGESCPQRLGGEAQPAHAGRDFRKGMPGDDMLTGRE
jgi:hypothetical protein